LASEILPEAMEFPDLIAEVSEAQEDDAVSLASEGGASELEAEEGEDEVSLTDFSEMLLPALRGAVEFKNLATSASEAPKLFHDWRKEGKKARAIETEILNACAKYGAPQAAIEELSHSFDEARTPAGRIGDILARNKLEILKLASSLDKSASLPRPNDRPSSHLALPAAEYERCATSENAALNRFCRTCMEAASSGFSTAKEIAEVAEVSVPGLETAAVVLIIPAALASAGASLAKISEHSKNRTFFKEGLRTIGKSEFPRDVRTPMLERLQQHGRYSDHRIYANTLKLGGDGMAAAGAVLVICQAGAAGLPLIMAGKGIRIGALGYERIFNWKEHQFLGTKASDVMKQHVGKSIDARVADLGLDGAIERCVEEFKETERGLANSKLYSTIKNISEQESRLKEPLEPEERSKQVEKKLMELVGSWRTTYVPHEIESAQKKFSELDPSFFNGPAWEVLSRAYETLVHDSHAEELARALEPKTYRELKQQEYRALMAEKTPREMRKAPNWKELFRESRIAEQKKIDLKYKQSHLEKELLILEGVRQALQQVEKDLVPTRESAASTR